jgi:hypothetical protein
MIAIENRRWLFQTCRSVGEHVEFAHNGDVDMCLCGDETRPCDGNCGLTDLSWIGWRIPHGYQKPY